MKTGSTQANAAKAAIQMNKSKFEPMGLLLVLLAAVALRLFNLEGTSLWMDEIYSLMVAHMHVPPAVPEKGMRTAAEFYHQYLAWQPMSWDTLLEALRINVHMPLYYVLLHPWLSWFGDSAAALRSFSALFSTLMLLPIYALGKALGGKRMGMLSLLVAACVPFQLYYAQEGRMYALSLFWAALSSLAFWKILYGDRPIRWSLLYALGTVAGAASHYMFVFFLGFQAFYGLLWLLRHRDWQRLACLAPAALGLLILAVLWQPVYLAQRHGVNEDYHFAKGLVGGMRYLNTLFWQPLVMIAGDNPLQRIFYFPLTVLASGLVLSTLRQKRVSSGASSIKLEDTLQQKSDGFSFRREGFLLAWIFVPLLLQIGYDLAMRTHISVIDRYGLLISPAMCLWVGRGLAIGLERLRRPIVPACAAMVVLAICAVWPYSPFRDEHNKDRSIRDKIAWMADHARPGDLVFVNGPWGAPLIAAYYLNQYRPAQPMLYWVKGKKSRAASLNETLAKTPTYPRVWLFRYRANNERGLQQVKDYLARLYPYCRKERDWFLYSRAPNK